MKLWGLFQKLNKAPPLLVTTSSLGNFLNMDYSYRHGTIIMQSLSFFPTYLHCTILGKFGQSLEKVQVG